MEHFIFLKSDDCLDVYPENDPQCFRYQLSEPILLEGSGWHCALRELKTIVTTLRNIYVYCDIIEDSNVLGKKLPILRRIAPESIGRVICTYDSCIAFKITRPVISSLCITIKEGEYTQTPLFEDEPSTCLLHIFKP